jgi:hypothetical protein
MNASPAAPPPKNSDHRIADATEKSLHQLEQINQKLDRILEAIDKLFAK